MKPVIDMWAIPETLRQKQVTSLLNMTPYDDFHINGRDLDWNLPGATDHVQTDPDG